LIGRQKPPGIAVAVKVLKLVQELLHFADVSDVGRNMRGLVILITTLMTFSVIARPHEPRFVPQLTRPMPPVNVP
jgi:hypothetical protein